MTTQANDNALGGVTAAARTAVPVVTHSVADSPLGPLTLVASDGVLSALYFAEHARRPAEESFGTRDDGSLALVATQLREYFAGERRRFDLELAPRGDLFQRRVWGLLRSIPYGETRSYGELAAQLGDSNLARAVGAANGRNPISIIVPCHRVVGASGNLVGYAGGLERKRFLLAHEESDEVRKDMLF